jgi:type II secretory ATPase GspE/PulE/Tfp pilus assembly ATPase PilB-like protein
MITMLQDGVLKAVTGVTSMEEVNRVTGEGEFLEKIYDQLMSQVLARKVIITEPVYEKTKATISNIAEFGELVKKSPTTEINKIVISAALMLGVGDIHIEPGADRVFIRFRIDGILKTVSELPLTEYPNLLGEVKLLSGMKTEVREGVIDSRFSIQLEDQIKDAKDRKVDVRVSIILGGYGETVVMRLLNQSAVATDILELGIRQENLDKIVQQVEKPNGLFLNTGPTGSGKTTTLYSILKKLNKPEVKIITVEDPIEYQMEGILQTPVNDKEGYTFATALRALLRQNPDIMMIGEIRDNETAQIAVQAALTGHLVLSTIHTNNAAGSIQRFLNMGVSPADLSTSVNAFMAQRLVRKLCSCKEKTEPAKEELDKIQAVLKSISSKTGIAIPKKIEHIWKPKGCDLCNHIGYKGRTTVSEVLVMDPDIQELISVMAITSKVQTKAVENGMLTMAQDGILKVIEGETSLEEVMRVTEV